MLLVCGNTWINLLSSLSGFSSGPYQIYFLDIIDSTFSAELLKMQTPLFCFLRCSALVGHYNKQPTLAPLLKENKNVYAGIFYVFF
jgi:hypothetical protein